MKTRPYDPKVDGDGYSKMVPMHVEPPEEAEVYVWSEPAIVSAFMFEPGDFDGIEKKYNCPLDGWTFRPTTPEPEKSYAEYLDEGDWFCLQHVDCSEHFQEARISDTCIRDHPEQYREFSKFIQDTLTEQEGQR